jgi:chromosome segregation ATPase
LKQSVGSGKKVAAALADELRDAQTQMQVMKQSLSNDAQIMRQKWEESQQEARKLQEKMDGQKFDVLEQRCAALGLELAKTSHELSEAQQETAKMEKQLRGLELKMPLFMRQGKNLVDPPQGDVTLVFTDVEGGEFLTREKKEKEKKNQQQTFCFSRFYGSVGVES